MKRMIIISALLAAVVAFGIAETAISSSLYGRIAVMAGEVESAVNENPDFTDDVALTKAAEVIKEWERWRSYARMTSNHSTVRGLEDRLYALYAYVGCRSYEDSIAYAATARELAEDLAVETYVLLPNLL